MYVFERQEAAIHAVMPPLHPQLGWDCPALWLTDREHLRKTYLEPLLKAGLIEFTHPDAPRSKNQRYRLTSQGKHQLIACR
jgi:hypothetical protein